MTLIVLSVMLSSCESGITESFYNEEAISASGNIPTETMPNMLRIKVNQEIADKFLDAKDNEGYVDNSALCECGFTEDGLRVRTTFMIGGKFLKRQKEAGLDRWFDVIYDKHIQLTKSSDMILGIPGVEYSEPVLIPVRANAVMDDPLFSAQWQFENTGKFNFKSGVDIRLEEAWERYGRYGNECVTVAVVDGGIDCRHEDLAHNMWVNLSEANGVEGIDDDGNGYIDDVHGFNFISNTGQIEADHHGTHVAGLIAAVNNNGVGVSSIAGGRYPDKGVQIMTLQTIDDEGGGADLEKVYQYAAENGAVICQNSWVYPEASSTPASVKVAINYFIQQAGNDENGVQVGPMDGGLVVFAAGNEAREVGYPAMYEPCVAVAAIAPTGKSAYYTCYGDWIDVCAPGGDLKVDGIRGGVYSTLKDNTYGGQQGTSMACPQVSGLAALIVSEFGGPGFTSERLRQVIEDSCDPGIYKYNTSMEGKLGRGMIDVVNALASFSTLAPAPVTNYEISIISNFAHFNIRVPEDPDDKICHALLFNFEKKGHQGDIISHKIIIDYSNITEDGYLPVSIGDFDFESSYTYTISAVDYAGNASLSTETAVFRTGTNTAPVITVDNNETIKVNRMALESRLVKCFDPDGHALQFSLSTDAPSGITCNVVGGDYILKVDGAILPEGEYNCIITFTDEYGASDSVSFDVISRNNAPLLMGPVSDIYINGVGKTVEINSDEYFFDPDGESLKFTFDIEDTQICQAVQKGKKIMYTSTSAGITKATVTATDSAGEKVSGTFTLTVRDDSKPHDIYPNPAVDYINIRAGEEDRYHVCIMNGMGRVMTKCDSIISMKDILTLDVSSYPPGVYIAEIIGADSKGCETRFVKL